MVEPLTIRARSAMGKQTRITAVMLAALLLCACAHRQVTVDPAPAEPAAAGNLPPAEDAQTAMPSAFLAGSSDP